MGQLKFCPQGALILGALLERLLLVAHTSSPLDLAPRVSPLLTKPLPGGGV